MPRIRNWKDLKCYKPSPEAMYKHIGELFTKDNIDWALIARHVDAGKLESMTGEIGLSEVIAFCPSVLEGRVRGRTVVDVNR